MNNIKVQRNEGGSYSLVDDKDKAIPHGRPGYENRFSSIAETEHVFLCYELELKKEGGDKKRSRAFFMFHKKKGWVSLEARSFSTAWIFENPKEDLKILGGWKLVTTQDALNWYCVFFPKEGVFLTITAEPYAGLEKENKLFSFISDEYAVIKYGMHDEYHSAVFDPVEKKEIPACSELKIKRSVATKELFFFQEEKKETWRGFYVPQWEPVTLSFFYPELGTFSEFDHIQIEENGGIDMGVEINGQIFWNSEKPALH